MPKSKKWKTAMYISINHPNLINKEVFAKYKQFAMATSQNIITLLCIYQFKKYLFLQVIQLAYIIKVTNTLIEQNQQSFILTHLSSYHMTFIFVYFNELYAYQQLYCMEESNKKHNHSFLDKFRGRTNKIDKNGPSHALTLERSINQPESKDQNGRFRPKKLASLDARNVSQDYGTNKTEINDLINNNPERKQLQPILTKRSTDTSIRSNKLDPINLPIVSPLKKSTVQVGTILPPSRSVSDKSQTLHRRAFGKYLKLDNDALRHFQFLLQIGKKSQKRIAFLPDP